MIRETFSRDDCRRVQPLLCAHADGALDDAASAGVTEHLADCTSCSAELEQMLQLRTLLGASSRPCRAPGHLADQLVAIAGADANRELWLSCGSGDELPSARRRRRSLAAAMVSLGTVAACGVLSGAWMLGTSPQEVDDPDGGSLEAAASTSSALGGEQFGASLDRVMVAASGLVSEPPACPKHFDCPQSLMGLPLVAVVADSRTAPTRARLTYRGQGTELTVVQQRGVLVDQAGAAPQARAWQSGDTVFCVIAASGEHAVRAEQELPHEPPAGRGALARLRSGLDALDGRRGG
ncbi:anti-sigma factor [Luteococcus peritonei]|uniref:Anti-sigma factor n=1 Tax=Luteococcus peritonei TaxID=88874 RepID=A0ABW4RWK9_9ACTN